MIRNLQFIAGLFFLLLFCVMNTEAAPSTGTIEVAFILSEFEDQNYQSEHDKDYFEDLAFGEVDSMWAYYDEVSRSELNIQGDVYGPYTLDGDAADYGTENMEFVRDSVEIADDDIDYRDYDAVMVIHSGPGEESSGNSDDIWSIHWSSSIETDDDGHEIEEITQAPEYELSSGQRNPLGVWCHEFGHELGIPDLYDTDGSSAGIGNWGIMASGSWADNGETPVYFSAWSRYWLGWIEPIVITEDINNLELEPIENEGNVYLLPIPGNWSTSKEYYLLENRQQLKYDSYLPGEGLLIWHIDEEIIYSKWNSNGVNADEEHKGVDLEEADGDDDLDSNSNRGDEDDPYTSGAFTKDSYPNSLAYNGTESGWKIENIETSGDNIILDISFLSKPHAIADADEAVITEGFELQFYGNESWDEDGNIVNYTWDFGDGKFAYNDNPKHIFIENGNYDVVLTVRDNNGLEDSFILNIFVNKRPIPVVQISKLVIMLGEEITFDASDSYDVDGEVEFYQWNFDDGYTSNMAIIDHEYKNSGIYNVSLKLIDDLSDITTVYYTIEVINKLPIVDFEINPDNGNTLVTFQFVDLSYDDDGEIEQWFWDFGDGETSNGQITEHQFDLPGIYYVTLSVTDDQDGTNSTIIGFEVENAPPTSQIRIPDGINLGNNNWKIPANRDIMIDGTASFDNEEDELEFLWTVNGQELSTNTIYLNLAEETTLELKVIDSRGGEDTETFTILPQNVPSLTIVNWEDSTQVIKNEIGTLQTYSENGEFNLYMWKVERLGIEINENILIDTANYDSLKPEWEEGEYLLKVSARDIQTNLWTENFSMTTFVYNNPHATFEFNDTINEGQWITFDSTESGGFWNGSNSLDPNELELSHKWSLDGEELAGTNELITTLIESGGIHTINLTVFQNPVGKSYYEAEFYADYKPWGIMNTFPQNPRYGEDFEIYLNAYDEEDEAYINFLKISVYDFEGTQRAELLYEDQGSNFNLIVEIEYTGTIILEYELIDEKGNFRTNISTIEVLGWPDIYIESLEIKGTKEKGKTQDIEFILKNYNKTYESVLYNGAVAIGTVDLLINDEIVKSWNYNIEGEESQIFNFEWIAPAGYYEFEVVASVSNGETILENNNMTKSATFKADVKSSILPYPNFIIVSILLMGISVLKHRKPN